MGTGNGPLLAQDVTWYWCAEGAEPLGFPTRYASRVWDSDHDPFQEWDGIGEDPAAPRRYWKGAPLLDPGREPLWAPDSALAGGEAPFDAADFYVPSDVPSWNPQGMVIRSDTVWFPYHVWPRRLFLNSLDRKRCGCPPLVNVPLDLGQELAQVYSWFGKGPDCTGNPFGITFQFRLSDSFGTDFPDQGILVALSASAPFGLDTGFQAADMFRPLPVVFRNIPCFPCFRLVPPPVNVYDPLIPVTFLISADPI